MTRSDPTYEYFRADAQRHIEDPHSPIETVADYFRHFGIVPPAQYGRPAYKNREVTGGIDGHRLEWLEASDGRWSKDKIDKSWGEPGRTIVRINRRWDHERTPKDVYGDAD